MTNLPSAGYSVGALSAQAHQVLLEPADLAATPGMLTSKQGKTATLSQRPLAALVIVLIGGLALSLAVLALGAGWL